MMSGLCCRFGFSYRSMRHVKYGTITKKKQLTPMSFSRFVAEDVSSRLCFARMDIPTQIVAGQPLHQTVSQAEMLHRNE